MGAVDAILLVISALLVAAPLFRPGALCPCHLCEAEGVTDKIECRGDCRAWQEWKTAQERRTMLRDERIERARRLGERLRQEIAKLRALLPARK